MSQYSEFVQHLCLLVYNCTNMHAATVIADANSTLIPTLCAAPELVPESLVASGWSLVVIGGGRAVIVVRVTGVENEVGGGVVVIPLAEDVVDPVPVSVGVWPRSSQI